MIEKGTLVRCIDTNDYYPWTRSYNDLGIVLKNDYGGEFPPQSWVYWQRTGKKFWILDNEIEIVQHIRKNK